jgi:toxin-antitoxin system PIN domain toxin
VIAVDTNVLVLADRAELPRHSQALQALRELAEGQHAWALPVFCLGEFVRVVSHPRLFDPPTPAIEAIASIEALFESPSLRVLRPGSRYWALFHQLVRSSGVAGNLVFDAQIAALCLEHGAATILTEDRDFAAFGGVMRMGLQDFDAARESAGVYRAPRWRRSRKTGRARTSAVRRQRLIPTT